MSVLLTRKAVLQAAIESTYNVAAAVGVNDGFLVSNPQFTIKPNILERDFVRNDLSPMPFIIGRKLASMEFTTELRGNGIQNSGRAQDAPMIARLFNACGYALTENLASNVKGPFDQGDPANVVTWAVSSQATAQNHFTASGNPNDGDVFVINGVAYMMKTAITLIGHVLIGANEAASFGNLAAAINGGAGSGTAYFAGTPVAPHVAAASGTQGITIAAESEGAWANSIACTYTPAGSSEGAWDHATLFGGMDCASNTDMIAYYVTVDTAGASGAAKVTVTSDTAGEGNASATITSGTPVSLGTKGLTLTPTFTGSLPVGQAWTVWLMPKGISLDPISDNFTSITLVLHKDGVIHTMPGSFGTFEITAQAGNYATIKWTFTGQYEEPVDDPNPAPVFERQLPSQVELARLRVGNFQATVEKLTFNQMNDIQVRPDVSSSDGYNGTRIVSRKPEGGIDPEADLVANNDFWGQMSAAEAMPFQMRVGSKPGNVVWFLAPSTQYSGLTYGDRNGILTYDAGLRFSRVNGNDEASFYFC